MSHRLAARRGKKRAIMAVAHSIVVSAFPRLSRNELSHELGANYFDEHRREQRVDRCARCMPWGGAEALRVLIAEAGFQEVQIRPVRITRNFLRFEEVVLGHLAATPMAPAVAAIDAAGRTALLRDLRTALQSYVSGDRLVVPA